MIEATVAMAAMAGLFVVFGAFRIADRGHGCDACGGAGEGCGGCAAADGACGLADKACELDLHSKGSPS